MITSPRILLLALLLLISPFFILHPRICLAQPVSATDALTLFSTEPGLEVELVAAEPTVIDPVAMAFDERGRLFVAENRGYPTGSNNGELLGRIALLEDLNKDGSYETRTDFATGLRFPNGLLPWRNGLLVTDAPDLIYLMDENGDGLADRREIWLTGFATNRSTQLRVNDPTLGPDGWIYLAGGLSGGSAVNPTNPGSNPLNLRSHDIRLDPISRELARMDGKSQFGLAFDSAGHRFICMNRVQVQHVVLPSHFLERHPNLLFSRTVQDCPQERIDDLLPGNNAAARIYPISDNITTADSHEGTFSAACSVFIWQGGTLPTRYAGRAFSCDPTGNLVHWDDLIPTGPTFAAVRSREPREFLASSDNWFRPVFLASGPDGAFYICDMYRKTIEHPEYLPEAVRAKTDFSSGNAHGRIWRVISASSSKTKKTAIEEHTIDSNIQGHKESFEDPRLASQIQHPYGWHRDTAHRLLFERRPGTAIRLFKSWFNEFPTSRKENRHFSPEEAPAPPTPGSQAAGRALALQLLVRWKETGEALHGAALEDPSPLVRETAWRMLAEKIVSKEIISERIGERGASDESPFVRFQCALVLGDIDAPWALKGLARIAEQDGEDEWMRAAVLSGLHERAYAFFQTLQSMSHELPLEFAIDLGRLLAAEVGPKEMSEVANGAFHGDATNWALLGLLEGLLQGWQDQKIQVPNTFFRPLPQKKLLPLFLSENLGARSRIVALNVLAKKGFDDPTSLRLFQRLPRLAPPEVQSALIGVLLDPNYLNHVGKLLQSNTWLQLPVSLRTEAVSKMIREKSLADLLLTEIESGRLSSTIANHQQRKRLLEHSDIQLRQRSEQLWTGPQAPALTESQKEEIARQPGSSTQGKELFKTHCAPCHRLERIGYSLGPDLFGIRNQSKTAILMHVLEPDAEIMPGFEAYTISLKGGEQQTGLITAETGSSVTLKQPLGQERVILRNQIEQIKRNEASLMPGGWEEAMTPDQLADLLSFLKGE